MSSEGNEQSEISGPAGNKYMISSRDMAALRKLMDERLEACGWKNFVRKVARLVLLKHGVNVTNDSAAAEIIPFAFDLVPDGLRKDLEDRVSDILQED